MTTLARHVLLADLAAAGVTDLVAEYPSDQFARPEPAVEVLASPAKQSAPVAAPAVADFDALKARSGMSSPVQKPTAPVAKPVEDAFDAAACLHFTPGKSAAVLVLTVTGNALVWPAANTAEGRLLARMAQATGVDFDSCAKLIVRETHGGGSYTSAQLAALSVQAQKYLTDASLRAGLVFGQVGLSAITGSATPLSAARGAGVEVAGVRLYATYQPAALLEQPLLKAAVWREALSFCQTFSTL
ncbi:MAG: hypothetical protein GC134_04950 [Proteobacteria bacterium]|nr:hypothetical protein [Pseudomonadota bacterium]